jgi:hypothetical protein
MAEVLADPSESKPLCDFPADDRIALPTTDPT